jgi:hypothetical protein
MTWNGAMVRDFHVDTEWLHDCHWITGDVYLFSLSDRNAIQLWDVGAGNMLWGMDMTDYGETTLLLSLS